MFHFRGDPVRVNIMPPILRCPVTTKMKHVPISS
jgi:hypothetical protein